MLNEKQVLKKLDIPDFRHMTKEKIIRFASLMPKMEAEVAKKALEQFPEFTSLSSDAISSLKEMVEKVCKSNDDSTKRFYDSCDLMISTLQNELERDNINADDKRYIIDQMHQVVIEIGKKDSENKLYYLKLIGEVCICIGGVVLSAASLLGGESVFRIPQKEYKDEED